jgi:hypothetical protein
MALAAGLVLPVAAFAVGPGPGGHRTPTAGGNQHPGSSRHQVSGTLTWMSGTTVPASLTVQAGSTPIIVTVPATTVVRGYGDPASLDEFAVNDRIITQGSFQKGSTTTFNARWIRDWSLRAHSRVVGSVLSMQSNGLTLQVARRDSKHSSYLRNQNVYVTLTASTVIMSSTVSVPVGALQAGERVLALGVYNRTQSTLTASRVRILSARRRHT